MKKVHSNAGPSVDETKQVFNQMDLEESIKEMESSDEITQKENFDHNQGLCIKLAVEMETQFKLYSYRILAPENYVENIMYLVKTFTEQKK